MRKKQITTYATLIDKTYSVSTAYRQCSSIYNPCWYYETIVFVCNSNGQIQKIKYSTDAGSHFVSAIWVHNRLVKIFTYLVQRRLRNNMEVKDATRSKKPVI